jgi:hydroxymethylpyrimidine pyrophosphatase-like HAD family hydrolase
VQALRPLESVLDAEDPIQVMFGGTRAEMDALIVPLSERLGGGARIERTVYPATDLVLLDVIDPAVGKAEALGFLQSRWGVAAAETLAIGDNWNDRDMVARAGIGFVMANADPELLALGMPVLPSNDDDGVALAIEEYVLGA